VIDSQALKGVAALEDLSAATMGRRSVYPVENATCSGGHQRVGAHSAEVHAASLCTTEMVRRGFSQRPVLAERRLPRLAVVGADAAYTGPLRSWVHEERGGCSGE
jgi:hypothetical protein